MGTNKESEMVVLQVIVHKIRIRVHQQAFVQPNR
jgi:hypothetical protein